MALGWRQGRNEVLALSDEMGKRLKGENVCQIHMSLVAAGKITTARTVFARHVKKYIQSAGVSSPAAGFVHSSSSSQSARLQPKKSNQPSLTV